MKIKIVFALFLLLVIIFPTVYCSQIEENINEELNTEEIVYKMKELVGENIDIGEIKEDLIEGKGINYGVVGDYIYNILFSEIKEGIKSCIQIFIILLLIAIILSLKLDDTSSVITVATLTGFILIVGIIIKNYATILKLFLNTVDSLTSVINIIAPFTLAMLIATSEVLTSSIISPVILFVTGLIGTIISYIVLPVITLSLLFNIVSNISDRVKLERFSKLLNNTAMWVLAVIFAVFLGILELESSISTSVDKVTLKATETAVSNVIPVVGKFVSDSLEIVMGSTEIIGKTIGTLGIICIVIVALVPVTKLVIYILLYSITCSLSEMLNMDSKITKLIEGMKDIYKTMAGIMIGVAVTFIISLAIIINLIGKVYS